MEKVGSSAWIYLLHGPLSIAPLIATIKGYYFMYEQILLDCLVQRKLLTSLVDFGNPFRQFLLLSNNFIVTHYINGVKSAHEEGIAMFYGDHSSLREDTSLFRIENEPSFILTHRKHNTYSIMNNIGYIVSPHFSMHAPVLDLYCDIHEYTELENLLQLEPSLWQAVKSEEFASFVSRYMKSLMDS